MSLDRFLQGLHFDTAGARPPDWQVDWDDKPYPYKLYRGLPSVALSSKVPLTLEERILPAMPGLREIGHFLWYVYGLNRLAQSVFSMGAPSELLQSFRRFVPSGGALYPNELYIYMKLADFPSGVYHYDVAHHRLVLLREGNFDAYLARALGDRPEVPECFAAVLVTTRFWKNFFKYHNFAYRLQGLDAGVLIGQLLEAAKRFGYSTAVYFRFLDRAVNHLLGVSEREESVYAVIALSAQPAVFAGGTNGRGSMSAAVLCRQLPAVRFAYDTGSRRIREYPMLIAANEASMLESFSPVSFVQRGKVEADGSRLMPLPLANRLKYDFAAVCRMRYSPDLDFVMGGVNGRQLAALLQEATASYSYRNDLDGTVERIEPRVSAHVCACGVDGVPDGAYRYDVTAHALEPLCPGDQRQRLQMAMSFPNVNLLQVPLCFHVAGDRDFYTKSLGFRGYRIQQMEAGMLTHRLLLAAFALGMGGHPLLGYDVNTVDEIYRLAPRQQTALIQIPVGPHRERGRLSGGLHG